MNRFPRFFPALAAALLLTFSACDSNEPDPNDGAGEEEVITLVRLTFGGPAATRTFDATFDEAGRLQEVDEISVESGTTYDVTIDLQNTLEDPPESITAEIRDEEPDAHRFFYVAEGGIAGQMTISDFDTDLNGDPLGLSFRLSVNGDQGTSGQFRVKLRHYEEDADLPEAKRNDTATAPEVPGVVETDVNVVFPITISG